MFGRDPFSLFRDDPFFSAFFGGFPAPIMQQPSFYHGQQQPRLGAPVIEELHEEGPGHSYQQQRVGSSNQPVVEEPDDVQDPHHRAHQRPKRSHPSAGAHPSLQRPTMQPGQQAMQTMPGPFGSLFGNLPSGGATYSYSSSSFSSSGPGGVTYQTTYSSRQGPGRVREVQSTVRDGRTGQHSMTISRGLGEKEHTISRTRDVTGQESHHATVRGMVEQDVDRFQEEWMQHAESSLQRPWSSPQNTAARPAASTLALPAAGRQPTQTYPVYESHTIHPTQQYGYSNQPAGYGGQQAQWRAH